MKSIKNLWLYIALGIALIILIGTSLPWASALDLYSFIPSIRSVSGWNMVLYILPALLALIAFVVPFWKEDKQKWLWGALGFGVISLVAMIIFAINIFAHTDELVLSGVPKFGFWLALIGMLGLVAVTALTLFGKKAAAPEVPMIPKA